MKKPDRYIQIQEPIWHNKSVGVALDNILDPDALIQIDIMYVGKKSQKRQFPTPFQMEVSDLIINSTGTQKIGSKTLYIVPISKLRPAPDATEKKL